MQKNSQLASLFGGGAGNSGNTANLAGLQTRAAVQSLIQQVFRVFAAESSTTSTPYISQNKKVTLYADSALHIDTGHLLLTRTSVRGVQVTEHGL